MTETVHPDEFETRFQNGQVDISRSGGLTKRELFAAMAMQGVLSGPFATQLGKGDAISVNAAGLAVECAEALIAALKEQSDE